MESIINKILYKLANNLQNSYDDIIHANNNDVINALQLGKNNAFIERLTVSQKVFNSMITSLKEIIRQPYPVGKVIKEWDVPHNGLHIKRMTCAIGKILIIYESRPNVTLDAFALCFKSGNCCVLRGGAESFETSSKIVEIIHKTFDEEGMGEQKHTFVEYVQTKERSAMIDFLKKSDEIDLVIPRGGKGLVEFVSQNTAIPILKHLDGNCHTYIEKTANPQKAIAVLQNAKMRRVSVCGATESLVIDRDFAVNHLEEITSQISDCEFIGCEVSSSIDKRITPASNEDFSTEYLDKKISVKVVENVDDAINFINKYSSKHTEAILSDNPQAVEKFMNEVDSANVMHNISTQFADGYEFGLGAEIGIATGKIHARGPVGLAELVTYKNIVSTNGYKTRD